MRKKTIAWFKQVKFNLLREESEGYAKLITELITFFDSPSDSSSVSDLSARIQSYIGYFNLDPNRVLAVILQCFEPKVGQGHDEDALSLLSDFNKTSLCDICGFQFQRYNSDDSPPPPASFFQLLAFLISHNLITINAFYPHLAPEDSEMVEQYKERLAEGRKNIKALTKVNLNTTQLDEAKDKDVDMEGDSSGPVANKKWQLLIALLDRSDWLNAEFLLTYLSAAGPLSDAGVRQALIGYISKLLAPLYRPIAHLYQFNTVKADTNDRQLINEQSVAALYPVLAHVGPHLAEAPVVFSRLCRVMKEVVKPPSKHSKSSSSSSSSSSTKEIEIKISDNFENIVTNVLFPALSLSQANVFLSETLWSILRYLPYNTRYKLYGYWQDAVYDLSPELMAAKVKIVNETKTFRKTIVKGKKIKETSRYFAKLALSHPTIVMTMMLENMASFDNLIPLIVDLLKYMTSLNLDVVSFVLLRQISNPKPKLKDDKLNEAHWFQSLSSFSGVFYR